MQRKKDEVSLHLHSDQFKRLHSNIRMSHAYFLLSVQKALAWRPKYYHKLT